MCAPGRCALLGRALEERRLVQHPPATGGLAIYSGYGKGVNYSSIEVAPLTETEFIGPQTTTMTTLYQRRSREVLPETEHDSSVGVIMSDEVIACGSPRRPIGGRFERVGVAKIAAVQGAWCSSTADSARGESQVALPDPVLLLVQSAGPVCVRHMLNDLETQSHASARASAQPRSRTCAGFRG